MKSKKMDNTAGKGILERFRFESNGNMSLAESLTRFECDSFDTGDKVASYALGMLAKKYRNPLPLIAPTYITGKSFPW